MRLVRIAIAPLVACAQIITSSAQQPQMAAAPNDPSRLTRPFAGSWVGTLDYRDFQSDEMVHLPTWLEATQSPDGSLHLVYTYDDGPHKVVVEKSTVTMDAATAKYSVTSGRDHSTDTYAVTGYTELAARGLGKLELTGKGEENNKPVDVRITITIGRNIYLFKKETRAAGGEFRFRDGYTLTRRDPPQPAAPPKLP